MTSKKLFDLLWSEPDCDAALQALAVVSSPNEAKKLQSQIADECRGMASLQSVESETKRDEAKRFYQSGMIGDALKIYQDLLKNSPLDPILYTNVSLCYAKLGDHRQALVNASVTARYLDGTWIKAQHRVASSYCHLGYVELAHCYIDTIECDHRSFIAEQLESEFRLSRRVVDEKLADSKDFDETVAEMRKPNVTVDQLLFLLHHCLYHFATGSHSPNVQSSVELIDKVSHIGEIASHNSIELANFSVGKQHVLLVYITFVAEYAKLALKFSEKLVQQQSFKGFIVKLAKAFSNPSGVRNAMRTRPFGRFIMQDFIKVLVQFATNSVVMKQFLLETAPFNTFEFHSKLSLAAFCLLPFHATDDDEEVHVCRGPELKFDFDCVPFLLTQFIREDSFFKQFDDKSKRVQFETSFAILAAVSLFEFHPSDSPHCSLLSWSLLLEKAKSARFCFKKPGIWTYAIRRLYRFADDAFMCESIGGDDILKNLSLISHLVENFMLSSRHLDNNSSDGLVVLDNWNETANAALLSKALSVLVNADHPKMRRLDDKRKQIGDVCFYLAAHFCTRSNAFIQEFAKFDFAIPQAVGLLLVRGDLVPKIPGALYYLSVASDLPSNGTFWRNRLLLNQNFKELVHRLVLLISASPHDEKVKTNAVLFLHRLLAIEDRCKNAVFQALPSSEEKNLVEMLVREIRKTDGFYQQVLSVSCGLLLSVLVKLDGRFCDFEEEIRTPDEEPIDTAYQRLLQKAK